MVDVLRGARAATGIIVIVSIVLMIGADIIAIILGADMAAQRIEIEEWEMMLLATLGLALLGVDKVIQGGLIKLDVIKEDNNGDS